MTQQPSFPYAARMQLLGTENAFKIGAHLEHLVKQNIHPYRLNLGEPDFNIPPWVKEEIHRQLDANNTHYCPSKGIFSLRAAIAKQAGALRHLDISPEQVIVLPGCKPAIGFAQQAYANPGDEVIYPSPGFPIYESFTRYLGLIPKPIPLQESQGFIFSPQALAKAISSKTALIFLNFPSNPPGGVASKEDLQKIADVITQHAPARTRIFSDEIYEHILFDNARHHSIASLPNMASRTLIASGFSKSFAWTGGRLGYVILPSIEEAEMFNALNINYFSCVPPYNQEGGRVALEHPMTPDYLADLAQTFQHRRDVALQMLDNITGVTTQKPKGAFYLFPNIAAICEHLGILEAFDKLSEEEKNSSSPSTLFQMFALYHHHVAILDRRSFGTLGSQDEHFIRLSIASDLPLLEQGIEALKSACQDATGFEMFMKTRPDRFLSR